MFVGCVPPVPESPFPSQRLKEPVTGTGYTLYLPSYYSKDRQWPLVIPLHGTYGFDSPDWQATEWTDIAEKHGLIVAAPDLRSVQGILPKNKTLWFNDLAADERAILALIDEVCAKYNADPKAVLLEGFSAGGFPLYYTGLRNPDKFSMIVGGAANWDESIFNVVLDKDGNASPQARALQIGIFYGKDDNFVASQAWEAFAWLRKHKFYNTGKEPREVKGGHRRRPDTAYEMWLRCLPAKYKK